MGDSMMAEMMARRRQVAQEAQEGGEAGGDAPCSNYRINMAAANFGECMCGFPKAAHTVGGPPSSGRAKVGKVFGAAARQEPVAAPPPEKPGPPPGKPGPPAGKPAR